MAILREQQLTLKAIDEKLQAKEQAKDERLYMGISSIADPCERAMWLRFRNVYREHLTGQQIRLLERGGREEAQIVKYLKSVGVKLKETGRNQREVVFPPFVKGHIDGIIQSGLRESRGNQHIAEFKTANAKNFRELDEKGVKAAKPLHYAQMQCYMLGTGIERAFYWCVNKDNDQVHTERIYLDKEFAQAMVDRGNRVACLNEPPAKLGGPSWYQCKLCAFHAFCHGDAEATRNCRTCEHMHVNSDGTWFCQARVENVPEDKHRNACSRYEVKASLKKGGNPWN